MNIQYTPLLEKTRSCKSKTIIHAGGARSSKSWSIAQFLVEKLVTQMGVQIGITRKTFPALRMTALKLVVQLLKEYGIYDLGSHNKTFNTFAYRNKDWPKGIESCIQFFGMDEPEKLKSTEFHYIWIEEANEFTYEDYTTLKLSLSGATEARNRILLTLNPIDEGNWIPKRLVSEDDVELIHSNYKDNPFLDRDYVQMLESLVKVDENAYRVYTLGLWGRLEDLIYKNWDEVDEVPEGGVWAYGLDFGYVHPSALIKVTLVEGEIYLEEKIYETGITVKDIIERLSHIDKGDIYADASAKQSIAEINGAGHRCYEAIKDVKHSIDLCKRQVFHVLKNSPNLPPELRGYHWKRDKNGELEDKPVKYKDDACDAFRYGVYGLVTRYGFATAEPNSEGPRQRTYA